MSCHDIGRGMNSVVRTTVSLMDQGKVSREAARTIISACANSVYWCDGNRHEATDYITRCLCGRCMRLVPEGEKLYSVYDLSRQVPNVYRLTDRIASDGLCSECFDRIINEYCRDDTAGLRERCYIEENNPPESYTSTGMYRDNNNGCEWVDYDLP